MPKLPPPSPNFVIIEPGKCKTLIFDNLTYDRRKIRDPKTGITKTITAMLLHVVEEDGRKVDKWLSVLSYKLQQLLYSLYEKNWLFGRPVRICKFGEDFATEYSVELV